MRLEAIKLWMIAITIRLPLQHFLGQKSFSPQGDDALGVKIFGMKGPDAHFLLIVFAEIKVGNPISFLVCHMDHDPSECFDVAADHRTS